MDQATNPAHDQGQANSNKHPAWASGCISTTAAAVQDDCDFNASFCLLSLCCSAPLVLPHCLRVYTCSTLDRITHTSVPHLHQLPFAGQVQTQDLPRLISTWHFVLDKALQAKKEKQQKGQGGGSAHQYTPSFALAALQHAVKALGMSGVEQQAAGPQKGEGLPTAKGGFSDVGRHTGSEHRDTCWPLVKETFLVGWGARLGSAHECFVRRQGSCSGGRWAEIGSLLVAGWSLLGMCFPVFWLRFGDFECSYAEQPASLLLLTACHHSRLQATLVMTVAISLSLFIPALKQLAQPTPDLLRQHTDILLSNLFYLLAPPGSSHQPGDPGTPLPSCPGHCALSCLACTASSLPPGRHQDSNANGSQCLLPAASCRRRRRSTSRGRRPGRFSA